MKTRFFLVILWCLLLWPALARATDFILITDIGTSAESIALGSVEGFSYSANAIFENPAGLYRIPRFGFAAFTTRVIDEVDYLSISLAGKTALGTWGLGFMEASVGNIDKTGLDSNNRHVSVGTFDYKNSVYKLSYQTDLSANLHVGAAYTYYYSTYYTVEGKGSDLDAGLIYDHDGYETSFFVRNLLPNSTVEYNQRSIENLPTHFVFSARFPFQAVEVLPQFKLVNGIGLPAFGIRYKPSFIPYVTLMGGFKRHLDVLNRQHQNASLGLSLSLFGLEFHYAYERSDYVLLDHKNYFSVSQNF